jgi:ABC-2 type transport system permease protein
MGITTNQFRAAFIISRYSLLAMLRSPTSIVFSLLFPVIFITVFGSIIGDQAPAMKVALAPDSDTANIVFKAIKAIPAISIQKGLSQAAQMHNLKKGDLIAILNIIPESTESSLPHYTIHLRSASSSPQKLELLITMLDKAVGGIDQKTFPDNSSIATITITKVPARIYRSIDFILPGQLGFSLLMAAVYGSSFLLFSLRQNLVFKRLRVAPINRGAIITGEMLSRLFFHMISFIIMMALGYFAFHFTLYNGLTTVLEMLVFSLFGLAIFMGIGFIISGVVQNENAIAPIANTVVLPQILLCGLFFPIENYPHWLQQFCDVLPLTLLVDGLRKIAFEDTHIWQMPLTLLGLIAWIIIILPLSIKSFRWE